ncbi:hypothetical protein JHK85_056685 [Glycine max]|nr:hypothetical protein JHK85_056685 [Glycine max]
MVKKPARLGKLIASALSFSLPRPAATAPKRPRGVLKGSKVQKWRELRELRKKKKKKEEETKPRRCRIVTMINLYIVPCSVFFVRPSKVLEICSKNQRATLLSRITLNVDALKKYTYGKHIVAQFEELVREGFVFTKDNFGNSQATSNTFDTSSEDDIDVNTIEETGARS